MIGNGNTFGISLWMIINTYRAVLLAVGAFGFLLVVVFNIIGRGKFYLANKGGTKEKKLAVCFGSFKKKQYLCNTKAHC